MKYLVLQILSSTNAKQYGESDFNYFLRQNAWWLALIVVGLIAAVSLGIIFSGHKRKGAKAKQVVVDATAYITALGGNDNIVSHELRGSRIVLVLKDYKVIDEAKLKEAGVDAIVMMSDKLTLVVKENAETVVKTIFGE